MKREQLTTAPDILKDARELYHAHRRAANKPSKAENLDKLWTVLNDILDDNGRDFSLAEVGRRLEKLGGPKTQSLRNAQGAHYRQVISAYANAVSGSTRYVAKTKSTVEQALDLISDPSVRATIRVALDEAKRLKVVNDNLHAAFKTLSLGASVPKAQTSTSSAIEASNLASQNNSPMLSARYANALRKGIDDIRLRQQSLQVTADGSIENEHGDKLFPPAFVDAIAAVLALIAPPS